jgi:hypothetical protein
MTAATAIHATVASTVGKIEQGTITPDDVTELGNVVRHNRESIPYLDRSFLNGTAGSGSPPPSGTVLVRYVGMVQDMMDTEYYLSEVNGVKTHYRDCRVHLSEETNTTTTTNMDTDNVHKLAERQPLVVVPIPFASRWALDEWTATARPSSARVANVELDLCSQKKRECERVTNVQPPTKRTALSTPETSMDDDDDDDCMERTENDSPSRVTLRGANNEVVSNRSDWWPAGCMESDPNQCPVLAKMYYDQGSTGPRLRLNEIVEMVGVLSVDPMDAGFPQDEWNDSDEFSNVALPPPSLLPRLHVLCHRRLDLEADQNNSETTVAAPNGDERSLAIQVFAEHIFGGNQVAAEALLMALMSMAEREEVSENTWTPIKTPSETTLGTASLNLILPSQSSCARMYIRLQRVLEKILPVVGRMELTRENLGQSLGSPRKTESGRLEPSPLQLPRGAALIVNQSSLTEGPVDGPAMETLDALNSLTRSHSVPYRFGQMLYTFEGDYRVIVLSSAARGSERQVTRQDSKLLPCTVRMKLSDEGDDGDDDMIWTSDAAAQQVVPPPDDVCRRIRSYLAQCRTSSRGDDAHGENVLNVPLHKTVLDLAQNDFIQRRADHRDRAEQRRRLQTMAVGATSALHHLEPLAPELGEEDFHRWLTIARLEARSQLPFSGVAAESETWRSALNLDDAMLSE